MRIIGIDPGLDGGLALFTDGQLRKAWVMPAMGTGQASRRTIDAKALIQIFAEAAPERVILEQALAMPATERAGKRIQMGAAAAFTCGKHYGQIEGILYAMQVPFEIVHPQAWQRGGSLLGIARESKAAAMALICARLFPLFDFRASERAKKPHSGITAATLIGNWAANKGRLESVNPVYGVGL